MLGKLLKHEFRATGRLFLPIFAFILVATPLLGLVTKLFGFRENDALAGFSFLTIGSYILMLFAFWIATFILLIIRFYRTMAKDEAYMTFSLPAKTSSILWSKTIVAFVWQIATSILIIASIAAFTFSLELWDFKDLDKLFDFIKMIFNELSGADTFTSVAIVITYGLALILGPASTTLQIFASIGLGQTARNHRIMSSIGFFLAFYFASQTITSIVLLPIYFGMGLSGVTDSSILSTQLIVMAIALIIEIIFGAVYFILCNYTFKKKLNLE